MLLATNNTYMDFPLLTDAKAIIIKFLQSFGLTPVGYSTQEVLQSYFNFKHKFIQNLPRTVLMSNDLEEKAKKLNLRKPLKVIEQKCIAGEDITPFLSK